jgi:thiol-disulfide isomerase/thioredoxin
MTKADVVKKGDMIADFELYDYDDKPHHLNEFLGKGKYTILEFSGIGCGPCQQARPYLEKFYKQYKDKFEMITISTDRLFDWKKKPVGEVSWHEWNDHNIGKDIMAKYDVHGIPTFFIISPEGKVERKCLDVAKFYEALKDYIPAEEVDKIFME